MVESFKIKDQLFNHRGILDHFTGLKVTTQSPKGVACSLNSTSNQVSKISIVGVTIDMIMDGRIAVASVDDGNAYVEYHTSTGEVVSLLVMAPNKGEFQVIARKFSSLLKNMEHGTKIFVVSVIAAILYCPEMRNIMRSQNPELNAVFTELDSYFDAAQDYKAMHLMDSNLFLTCDIMYYGIFKQGTEVEINAEDEGVFDAQMQRFLQNNSMRHIASTRELERYTIPEHEEATQKTNQNSLFTEPLADFFERCKRGEFLIRYPWPEIRKNMIVPLSFLESFFPTESFRLMLLSVWYQIREVQKRMDEVSKKYPGKKLAELVQEGAYDEVMGKNPINIKVMGKPGTGKTTVIEAVLASLGYPKGLISCKDRMEEDDIEGLNKFVNGTVLNIPTKAGQLHSDGGAILLEEFNLPDPGILQGALGQALAYPFILKEDGYKEKRRHPMTIYFATMNIGTAGTKPMNEALSSRFPEGYVIEDVPEAEFISILVASGYEKSDCRKVYRVYTQILNYLREYHEELSLSITLRHCLNALDKLKIGFTEKQAYENTFLSQLYSSDPEVANDIRETLQVLM